jgi:hypothetical protein
MLESAFALAAEKPAVADYATTDDTAPLVLPAPTLFSIYSTYKVRLLLLRVVRFELLRAVRP